MARKSGCSAAFWRSGVASVAGMFFIYTGDWVLASVLFILANIGANGSFVFYDALLPHIASDDEIDSVSTAGYALGYLGGGTLLALNLAWILKPRMVRAAVGRGHVCRAGDAADSAELSLGRGLVAGLFDSAVSPRAASRRRAAGSPLTARSSSCRSERPSIA